MVSLPRSYTGVGKAKKKPSQKDPYLVIARLQPARAAATAWFAYRRGQNCHDSGRITSSRQTLGSPQYVFARGRGRFPRKWPVAFAKQRFQTISGGNVRATEVVPQMAEETMDEQT